ncbi:hypothetical protein [Holdemania filiformis]|uniref:hypothetical protein n=1 Tax=Holdemania filiformis TaxID=61171 RepID=UPI00242A3E5A|nr:hypothetical protein [Holdemania filiformis]
MDERIKRTKDKLRVYGNYTRQIQQLEHRLQQIEDAIAWHEDWPEQAAKECGIHRLDPKHPAVQRMTIEQASLELEIDQAYVERQLLGLDAWLDSLSGDDRQIIRLVYEAGYSYQAAAPLVNLSKSGLRDRIDAICKSPHACG